MSKQVLIDQDYNSASRILNLPAPGSDNEPVRLADLNSAVEGLAWKDSARVATSSNVNLASPGSTLDGITMATNDRFVSRGQTSGPANGIYIWNGAAVAATRAPDASTAAELEQAVVTIEEGTDAGATFRQTAVNFTLGTDSVTWVAFGTSAPSATESTAGIAEIATQTETDTGTDDARIVTPLKLATWAGRIKKYPTLIGDGSATSFTVTHNLGSRDVIVSLYRNSGSYDEVIADVQHTTTNTCTVTFAVAPSSNQFKFVAVG